MKIISWNVNGIRAVSQKGFLPWFEKESPDILCLQETKAIPEQITPDLRNPLNYHSYWNWPEAKRGYSGVAVFTKIVPLKVEKGFGVDKYDNEGRALILHFEDFILINIYFPNGQKDDERLQYKLNFYDVFLEYCNNLVKHGKNLVMCGDYNTAHKEIDLARPKDNEKRSGFLPIERAWMDKYIANGYVDTFRVFEKGEGHYSWWDYKSKARDRNVGWRIDYFFVNNTFSDKVKRSFILKDVFGSDHCPIGIELNV